MRGSFVLVCTVSILALAALYNLPVYLQCRKAHLDCDDYLRRLDSKRAEIRLLTNVRDRLRPNRDDPRVEVDHAAIERIAREKFGLCRPNEQIYHFDPPAPKRTRSEP